MIPGSERRERIGSALAVAGLHVAAIYGLVHAFGVDLGGAARLPEKLLSITLERPEPRPTPRPPKPRPTPKPSSAAAAAAAPEGARAAPVLAAKPLVVPPEPPRIAAAVAPGEGTALRGAGLSGTGAGAGGTGTGTGGGGEGSGTGGGGTELRQIAGEILESDYPGDARRRRLGGRVQFRFTVGVAGRVTACTITRTSGVPSLDEATCRLIAQRFRYEPSRDPQGRPIPDVVEGEHDWIIGGRSRADEETLEDDAL